MFNFSFSDDPTAPLGLENGLISNAAFNASHSSGEYLPSKARLNNDRTMGWASNESSHWISIDLERNFMLTGIAFQGSVVGTGQYLSYIQSMNVSYLNYTGQWEWYEELGAIKV